MGRTLHAAYLATWPWLIVTAAANAASDSPRSDLAAVAEAEQQRIAVMERATRAVVSIFSEDRGGGGSGVIISPDGVGITNFHVVAPMLETRRGLGGLADGKVYPLEVLGIDPTGDVAMFRLTGRDRFEPAPLGDSDGVAAGDEVFAAGNPFMLAEDYTPTVTSGIVSGINRYQYGSNARTLVYTDCIQVDASINPGNSGGPLFNMRGEVIGINGRASFLKGNPVRQRVNVGVAYAISINQIKRFIPKLKAGEMVEHGSLGATVSDAGYRRVTFDRVLDPSAASAAGIRVGDRLIEFDGRPIRSANDFTNLLGTYPAGWEVEVVFEHEGQVLTQTVRLDQLPVKMEWKPPEPSTMPAGADAHESPSIPAPSAMPPDPVVARAMSAVLPAVVKIYGGRIGNEQGSGTGVIVSQDGLVVTVLSLMLEAADLRAVTAKGHVYPVEVIYRDNYRQLALLKMAAQPRNVAVDVTGAEGSATAAFPALPPAEGASPEPGDRILAIGNPFKIADGEENCSVTRGIVSARTRLNAVRPGAGQPFAYRGDVILLDAITSNPGSPGSAVVDLQGRLVGLVGEIVESRATNTLLNYAYSAEEVLAFVADAKAAGPSSTRPETPGTRPGYHGIRLTRIGYRTRLPFVEAAAPGSPAAEAGVRRGDLVVSANGTPIPQVRDFQELCEQLQPGEVLSLVLKRGDQLVTIRMTLLEEPK